MKLPKLTAIIEKEGKWYIATCPELCVASQGRTNEEAKLMRRKAVELLLEEADETEIRRRLNRGVTVKKSWNWCIPRISGQQTISSESEPGSFEALVPSAALRRNLHNRRCRMMGSFAWR